MAEQAPASLAGLGSRIGNVLGHPALFSLIFAPSPWAGRSSR